MSKLETVIEIAENYIGKDFERFTAKFGGGCWAWCAAFTSVVLRESGVDAPWSTSCNEQIRQWKERGCWRTNRNIQIGDIVYYNWDSDSLADHVGICTAVLPDGRLRIVEGNYGDLPSALTKVGHRFIERSYSCIFGYARPDYETETEIKEEAKQPEKNYDVKVQLEVRELLKGSKGHDVEAMQAILIAKGYSCGRYGSDGDFGIDTENSVKEYQRANGLEVDGICGKMTWTKLLAST